MKNDAQNINLKIIFLLSIILWVNVCSAQSLPPKKAYPLNVKQIHSGHSLTDPLFANWPGQYVNLIGHINTLPAWQLFDAMVGKSTTPGSAMKARWETPPGFGAPDARHGISNWELLTITEGVPLRYEGGNSQQWYLDGIQEQKQYLSLFVNNAWTNGNNRKGTPTLLWTTWTNINNSDGPWRQMLDLQGAEFERMQDYANQNRPNGAPPVYIIPGHKMMARLHDDIQRSLVPGITNISQFFSDNIHTNNLGSYAISMIHYACIFNKSPVGLPNNLLPNAPAGTAVPSQALATYLQTMIWDVVTNYPRTGIYANSTSNQELEKQRFTIYPNPVNDELFIQQNENSLNSDNSFTIYNLLGSIEMSGKGNSINVKALTSGYHVLKIGHQHFKFIKN
jgi:Secretion system C-terminal sorting domain